MALATLQVAQRASEKTLSFTPNPVENFSTACPQRVSGWGLREAAPGRTSPIRWRDKGPVTSQLSYDYSDGATSPGHLLLGKCAAALRGNRCSSWL